VGIRKTRGVESKSPTPIDKKATLKPLAGVELKCRIIVMTEMPNAAPTDRNIPRRPVIVATFWGMSSIQALLDAGKDNPIPTPVIIIRIARACAAPSCIPMISIN